MYSSANMDAISMHYCAEHDYMDGTGNGYQNYIVILQPCIN